MSVHFSAKKQDSPPWGIEGQPGYRKPHVEPVEHEPGANASWSDAEDFVKKVTRGGYPFLEDYLDSADPYYLKNHPRNTVHRRDPKDLSDQGVDHLYSLPNNPGNPGWSLKAWARSWKDAQTKSTNVKPYREPATLKSRSETKKPEGHVTEPESILFTPDEGVPIFIGDHPYSPTTKAFAPHDAYNEPVTHSTPFITHHCEKDLPVCSRCGTRDQSRNLNDFGSHKLEMRRQCDFNREHSGVLPIPVDNKDTKQKELI